jgi:hypothetical protein
MSSVNSLADSYEANKADIRIEIGSVRNSYNIWKRVKEEKANGIPTIRKDSLVMYILFESAMPANETNSWLDNIETIYKLSQENKGDTFLINQVIYYRIVDYFWHPWESITPREVSQDFSVIGVRTKPNVLLITRRYSESKNTISILSVLFLITWIISLCFLVISSIKKKSYPNYHISIAISCILILTASSIVLKAIVNDNSVLGITVMSLLFSLIYSIPTFALTKSIVTNIILEKDGLSMKELTQKRFIYTEKYNLIQVLVISMLLFITTLCLI